MQTETDTESSISINNEIIYENNISEEISSHHNSAEVIDQTCYENGNNLLKTEEEVYVTSIHYIIENNNIYMNNYDSLIHKYYARMSKNHEDVSLDKNLFQ